ncbi:hypothetical protein LX32DRAFT_643091 [Colletotrichum zoysiae]|uniref:Uncharacterized protein n=1 Tax=Colletotrichum zoysiae TaxID=1216348 RepID=A0AAD9HA14_9PEZI|nr:hypothetical protein LX32DRAFT_643091 [Colletotrichum zoysiae]
MRGWRLVFAPFSSQSHAGIPMEPLQAPQSEAGRPLLPIEVDEGVEMDGNFHLTRCL